MTGWRGVLMSMGTMPEVMSAAYIQSPWMSVSWKGVPSPLMVSRTSRSVKSSAGSMTSRVPSRRVT